MTIRISARARAAALPLAAFLLSTACPAIDEGGPDDEGAGEGWTRRDEGRDEEGRDEEGRAEEGRAEEGRAEEGRDEEGRAEERRAEEGRAEEGRAEEGRAEEGRAEEGRDEEGRAEEGSLDVWTCSVNFYGTGDGCDCGCGDVDPDCALGGCTDAGCFAAECSYCWPDACEAPEVVLPEGPLSMRLSSSASTHALYLHLVRADDFGAFCASVSSASDNLDVCHEGPWTDNDCAASWPRTFAAGGRSGQCVIAEEDIDLGVLTSLVNGEYLVIAAVGLQSGLSCSTWAESFEVNLRLQVDGESYGPYDTTIDTYDECQPTVELVRLVVEDDGVCIEDLTTRGFGTVCD